jgi:hypothetical protein
VTDLIVGAAANYRWETSTDCTFPFVVSMRRSGYKGRCVFVVSSIIHPETVAKYEEYGVELYYVKPKDEHDYPHVFRFRAIPEIIKASKDLRYVLALDVKDIIFQSDPTVWLEKNLAPHKLVGFSYGIKHADSPHARKLFTQVFGSRLFYQTVAEKEVHGVGMVCGLAREISELSQDISDFSDSRLRHEVENSYMVADQQAYNLLLTRDHYKNMFKAVSSENEFFSLGEGEFDMFTGVLFPSLSSTEPSAIYHHNGYPNREIRLREKYKG